MVLHPWLQFGPKKLEEFKNSKWQQTDLMLLRATIFGNDKFIQNVQNNLHFYRKNTVCYEENFVVHSRFVKII
jgi:hypothetical protein